MKRTFMAFLLGIVIAWVGLPKATHKLYWVGMVGTAVIGYLYARGLGPIFASGPHLSGNWAFAVVGMVFVGLGGFVVGHNN